MYRVTCSLSLCACALVLLAEAVDPDCPADASPIDGGLFCTTVKDQSECNKKYAKPEYLSPTTAIMCSWVGRTCLSTGGEFNGLCKLPAEPAGPTYVECEDMFWKGAATKDEFFARPKCFARIAAGEGDPGYHGSGWCGDGTKEDCKRWCDEDSDCHAFATNEGRCRVFENAKYKTCDEYSFNAGPQYEGRIVTLRTDRIP